MSAVSYGTPATLSTPARPASTKPNPAGVNGIIPAMLATANAAKTMTTFGRTPAATSTMYNAR
jgi:hypothetical protein